MSPGGAWPHGSTRHISRLSGLLATAPLCAQDRVACWHQDGVTRWAHAQRAGHGHAELIASLGTEITQMTRWMRAPCVGHGHFPRAKWAIGKAVPQLNAVAMGPSDVAAGLPEQDELARSQLHGHGLRWAHQQSNAGLPPQCRTVAARLAKRARPKIRERKQALLGYPPNPTGCMCSVQLPTTQLSNGNT